MRQWIGTGVLALVLIVSAAVGYFGGWQGLASIVRDRSLQAQSDTLDDAAAYMLSAGPSAAGFAIAATVVQAGHWRLVNRAGEQFTAVGPHELHRALATLTPNGGAATRPLHVLIDSQSLFGRERALRTFPAETAISVLISGRAFSVVRPNGVDATARIAAAPGLLVEVGDRAAFLEVLNQIERPLERGKVRMIALEPGGAPGLLRYPVAEPGARHPRPDIIDPKHLGDALGAVSGQTVVLSGRLDRDKLIYKPGSLSSGEISMDALKTSVRNSDANLVLLDASSARQPGTRNWLWQRIALSNVDKALAGVTLGEFLRALAGEPEMLVVRAMAPSGHRIDLMFEPLVERPAATVARLTKVVSGTWSNIVSETAGSVSVRSLKASLLTVSRQRELDRRIIPGIPYVAQAGYLVLMAAGLLAFQVVNAWWCRIWPNETEADYSNRAGLVLARLMRGLALVFLFLPVAGLAALCVRVSRRADVGAV